MSLFPKKQGPMLPNQSPRQHEPRKPATKQDKRWMALLIGCTVVSTLFYFGMVALSQQMESLITAQIMGLGIMILYAVAAAGFLIAYVIYNRAFTRDNVTPEMLPDTMSQYEKEQFIRDGVDRKRKSKWMIVVLFSLFSPLAIDFILLIALPTLFGSTFGEFFGV